jgi:hypothetical protein
MLFMNVIALNGSIIIAFAVGYGLRAYLSYRRQRRLPD